MGVFEPVAVCQCTYVCVFYVPSSGNASAFLSFPVSGWWIRAPWWLGTFLLHLVDAPAEARCDIAKSFWNRYSSCTFPFY